MVERLREEYRFESDLTHSAIVGICRRCSVVPLSVMRVLLVFVLASAAVGCILGSSGLAVPPHVDPPRTPRFHDHVLAAYRYPLFLMRLKMLSQPVVGPSWTLQTPGSLALGGLVLATLALIVPRLPRPTRRGVAILTGPAIRLAQWRVNAPLEPPRAFLLETA